MAPEADDAHSNMPAWLDSEFLQKILRESTHDDTLTVEKFSAGNATGSGDHYASDMFRVEVSVRGGDGEVNTRSLLVKLPPSAEEMHRLVMHNGVFEREINMFGDTLPRIGALLGERVPFASALYTRVDPSPLIVLEDLSVEGYRMAQRTKGLDLAHASLCMRTLGRYHAATVALLRRDSSSLQSYRSTIFADPTTKEGMGKVIRSLLLSLAEEVESWPDVGADYATRLRHLATTATDRMVASFNLEPEDYPVLVHGDLWVNNMLFHYNDIGDVDDVKFVDFQISNISSPAIDLNYFLYNSLSDDLRRDHSEPLLREYHVSLCDTMNKLGLAEHAPSFEHILQDCERKAFYAMYSTITVWPIAMCKSKDGFDIEGVLKGESSDSSKVWGEETLNAGIRRMLPEFHKKGIF